MAFDPFSDITYISQTLPGASIPLEKLPKHVVPVGVILLESGAADEQDPELLDWLKRAPTVVINLGSLFKYSDDRAMIMAQAIQAILNFYDIQVLWKMAGAPEIGSDYLLPLTDDVGKGRVRIMEWLPIDTLTLLTSGCVVLSVHHGGSSSYVCILFFLFFFFFRGPGFSPSNPSQSLAIFLDHTDKSTCIE